jgi:hypothetical protein
VTLTGVHRTLRMPLWGRAKAFDVQSPLTNLFGNRRPPASGMAGARFRWGAFSAAAVRRSFPDLTILQSFPIFPKLRRDEFASERDWRMARATDRMRAMWIAHARLPRQASLPKAAHTRRP